MAIRFFDSKFNFDSYINERLLEISDEGERRALKDVMRETLIPFYQHTEEAYNSLEKRLQETKKERKERFELVTGIADKRKVDITEEAFVPMQYEDIYEQVVDIEEMKEALERGEAYTIMRVFFKMDYQMIKQMEMENRVYKGIIYTQEAEYPAFFTIKPTQLYLKQIAELYQIFADNAVEWKTVCSPYLFKYFDVKVIKTECPLDAEIKEVTVDFDEYQKYARFDLIPMWNVRIIEERSGAYPAFSIDKIHYEHIIYKGRFKQERDYLISGGNTKLWNVFRMDGDIHIICDDDKPVRWKMIEFNYDVCHANNTFPIFGNYYQGINGRRCIHTYAEVRRYIKELGYEQYLELKEIKPIDKYQGKNRQTYSADWFMKDEIRTSQQRSNLLFVFQAVNRENYLNEDIMSYLVSKIQWQLPEYDCMGELL